MNADAIESIIHWLGGLLAVFVLGILLYGIWMGSRRQAGRTSGHIWAWFRSPVFYLISSVIFLGLAWLGWIPLPITVSPFARTLMLVIGSLLFFPGLMLLLWGRLELGKYYFVSTARGAQLFKDQPLITSGPYAFVRHPMYAGLMLAGLGSLLIYFTWTAFFSAVFAPLIMLRARREEAALAEEFGEEWRTYCKRVPAILPRITR